MACWSSHLMLNLGVGASIRYYRLNSSSSLSCVHSWSRSQLDYQPSDSLSCLALSPQLTVAINVELAEHRHVIDLFALGEKKTLTRLQRLNSPQAVSIGCDHFVTQLHLVMQIPLALGWLFVSDRIRWSSEEGRTSRTNRIYSQCEISQWSFASRRCANTNEVTKWNRTNAVDGQHGISQTTTTGCRQTAAESLAGNLSNSINFARGITIKKWLICCVLFIKGDTCITLALV